MGFLLGIFGSRFNLGLTVVLILALAGGAAFWRIDSLQRDQRETKMKNEVALLTENLNTVTENYATYEKKVADMTARLEALNRRMGKNATQRDDTNKIILPESNDTTVLEEGANRMNDVFGRMGQFGRDK